MLVGTEIGAALTALGALKPDLFGMNCATGPGEMQEHLRYLAQHSPFPISCLPNAGLPSVVDGRTHYDLTPEELAQFHRHHVADLGAAVVGGCCGTSPEHLRAFERADEAPAMDSQSLAHLVSCPTCLDTVNALLGLPLLAERYPTDTLDKDTDRKGGSGGGTPPGASMNETIGRLRRRAREAFEHDPQELCVSVNGYLRSSQKISSELRKLPGRFSWMLCGPKWPPLAT